MRKLTKGERRALELALSDSLGSQGSGVQFATVLHLEALGLITYTAGMYKHETRGLFGRGNWRSHMYLCWTAKITEAGRALASRGKE